MSLINFTWCISTSSLVPHITHEAPSLDLVNFLFHVFSIFFRGSWDTFTAFPMLAALVYAILIKEVLIFFSVVCPRSIPNFPNAFAAVLSLNLRARVNAHDSFTNQPIHDMAALFLAKL